MARQTKTLWDWSLWGWWVLVVSLAGFLGGDISLRLSLMISGMFGGLGGWLVFGVVFGLTLGLVVGVAQGLLLQSRLKPSSSAGEAVTDTDTDTSNVFPSSAGFRACDWIAATTFGFAVGSGAGWLISYYDQSLTVLLLAWLVIGASGGVAQWLVLRRAVARAIWWPIITTPGVSLSWYVSDLLRFDWLVSLLASITTYAIMTATVAVWLLCGSADGK